MSRSVRDLVDALRPDHEAAVEPVRFLLETARRGRLRRARRRRLVAGLSALVLVIVLIGLPIAFSTRGGRGGRGESPAGPTTAPVTTPSVAPFQPHKTALATRLWGTSGPWTIATLRVADWGQEASVTTSSTAKGTVTAYEPGAFDPTQVRLGTPATVRGQPAWYRVMNDPETGGPVPAGHGDAVAVLAWQYGPDAWVAVQGSFGPDPYGPAPATLPAALQEVADALVVREPEPVRLPFTMSYLPAGIHPVAATLPNPDNAQVDLEFERDAAPGDRHDDNRYQRTPLTIATFDGPMARFTANTTLGGRPAMKENHRITMWHDGFWLMIESGPLAAVLSPAEYERIYDGMTFADWNTRTTWFPATGVPGG